MFKPYNNFLLSTAALGFALSAAISMPSLAATAMTPENWRLNLDVSAGTGAPDNSTQLGTAPDATFGYDEDFDFFNPPPIGEEYVDTAFVHTAGDGWLNGAFATDIQEPIQPGGTATWDSIVIFSAYGTTDNPAPITVTWPGIVNVPQEIKLTLQDPNDLNGDGVRSYDMRGVSSFVFPSAADGTAKQYALAVTAERGEDTPPPVILVGDLNFDGRVNVQDATLTLRAAVGSLALTEQQRAAADVNLDGRVNVQDATLVLRTAVGSRPLETR